MGFRSKSSPRNLLGLGLGILISGACIWLVMSRVEGRALLQAIGRLDPAWFCLALLAHLGRITSLVWRWRTLLAGQGVASWGLALESLAVGYSANTLLPFRTGDAARVAGTAKYSGIPVGKVSAALLLERIGDALALVILAAISLFFLPDGLLELLGSSSPAEGSGFRTGMVLLSVGLVLALLLWVVVRWAFPGLAEGIRRVGVDLKDGLAVVRDGRTTAAWLCLSLVTWFIEAATYAALLRSLGLDLPQSAGLVACSWGSLIVMIPSAPGGFGSFELAVQSLLALYGVQPSAGLAASLLIHATVLLPITVLGVFWIPKWIRNFTGRMSGPVQ